MAITYHMDVEQNSDAWHALRRGILTASEMKFIIAPPPEPETRVKKNGEPYKQREWKVFSYTSEVKSHLYELLAQRVTGYVEPTYQSHDMERGNFDEEYAREKYDREIAPVKECGLVVNDDLGFPIAYSPDGLVGDEGLIECKSRIQKWQMKTIIECVPGQTIPDDYLIQCQTGLYVTKRKWLDLCSFSGGMKMPVIRTYPIPRVQAAIEEAACAFEAKLQEKLAIYRDIIASDARLVQTERLVYL